MWPCIALLKSQFWTSLYKNGNTPFVSHSVFLLSCFIFSSWHISSSDILLMYFVCFYLSNDNKQFKKALWGQGNVLEVHGRSWCLEQYPTHTWCSESICWESVILDLYFQFCFITYSLCDIQHISSQSSSFPYLKNRYNFCFWGFFYRIELMLDHVYT